ncbi:hypothetical protein FRC10_001347 [Ceratobasidium sp. 414]|nr:hypothetical protein FRC10_001347 [Ceratobasidium sp. 414]
MSGNLSRSMRENYGTHGVDENESARVTGAKDSGLLVCDLAAGRYNYHAFYFVNSRMQHSGEVTIALQEWWETSRNRAALDTTPNFITSAPQLVSRPAVARPPVGRPNTARPFATTTTTSPLLAPFPVIGPTDPALRIVAADPYTADAYLQRTGLPCIALSFQDVAQDGLPEPTLASPDPPATPELDNGNSTQEPDNNSALDSDSNLPSASTSTSTSTAGPSNPQSPTQELYDLVICSFALHLVTSPGALFALLSTLSYGARWLVVLEPHKKPEIKEGWGWVLWDVAHWKEAEIGPGKEGDFVKERHVRSFAPFVQHSTD